MEPLLVPIILSGGSGTRLWPLSRRTFPKQFHRMASACSLFQETLTRLSGLPNMAAPILVCNEQHRFLAMDQAHQIKVPLSAILLEPVGRNTAPATACAALHALAMGQAETVLLVMPADHVITRPDLFRQCMVQGLPMAQSGLLVTFGILPNRPETGFGYIQRGTLLGAGYAIDRFVEKPNQETAQQYVDAGDYYWNSGIFLLRADQYLSSLREFAPGMSAACEESYRQSQADFAFLRLGQEAFTDCPADSIDYAVMEKTTQGAVIPLDAGWSDVGSWSALWEIGVKDAAGNLLQGDVLAEQSQGCYLRAEHRLLTTVGLQDHIVIETEDSVVVAPMARAQEIKLLVERLQAKGRPEVIHPVLVHRPWGTYQTILLGDRFKVKRITVHPGATLSLQLHHHRAEHWVVVHGTAKVTKQEPTGVQSSFLLTEDESTYIPLGIAHRLENPGKIPLELIEVQSGSYLGEEDIVRLDDKYGRIYS